MARTLEEVVRAGGTVPRIHYGCELHLLPENVEKALRRPDQYTIGHRSYILVELSNFAIPETVGQIFRKMKDAGMVPILAHPERNPLLRDRRGDLEEWIGQGCLLQITSQSFFGRFGKSARASAAELLERGMVHFVASDAHDLANRPPGMEAAWYHVEQQCGTAAARRIFLENPKCVLEGRPVPETERVTPVRKWFGFW